MSEKKKLSKAERAKQEKLLAQQEKERKQQMLSPFEIHVMPQKFIGAEVSKKQRGKKFPWKVILIVILVVVFVGALAFGAFQLYKTLNQPIANNQPKQVAQEKKPVEKKVVENVDTTQPQDQVAEQPTDKQADNTQTQETTTQDTTNQETATPQETDITTPTENTVTPTPTQLSFSVDTDSDGLTDEEEDVYGTELRKPDTDGDGFTDGQELLNLYSPFASGSVPLEDVASINKIDNSTIGYTILIPAKWLPIAVDQSKLEYSFTSITGEIVYLNVLDNQDQTTLSEWLIINQPNVNPNIISDYTTKKGLKGIKTSNGLVYYINVPKQSKVYKFTYDPGNVKRLNFMTTFQMMVNSLTIK